MLEYLPDISFLVELAFMLIKVFVVVMALFLMPVPITWIERKVAGHIHARLGPFRVGPHGLLQAIADTIKMFTKEQVVPAMADKVLFRLAPLIAMVPAVAVFAVVPFGESVHIPFIDKDLSLVISDMNVGVLYVLAMGGMGVYGIIFGGWASNSKYALLGGLRSTAQMISYEVALSFAVIGVIMITNTLNVTEIVRHQSGGFMNWNIMYLPVGPVWFMIFLIAGIAECNRIPFDLPEDEGTLGSGFNIEYGGMMFAYFALAEYVAMMTICVFSVLFFFGGWDNPFGSYLPIPVPPVVWFFAKVAFFIYLFMWLRFTLPRYRYDQLMDIGWKILIPISLVNIFVTGVMRIWIN